MEKFWQQRLEADEIVLMDGAEHGVAVAGSISTEPPGFDRDAFLSPEKELV